MPDWVIGALAVFAFSAFFFGVSMLIFRISGWYALGKAYPRPQSARPIQTRWGLSGKIGCMNSNNAFIVGVDRGGLYLGYIPPWNWVTPALFIPWDALRFERRWKSWWTRKVRYRTVTGTQIELYGLAAKMAEEYAPLPE